LSRVFQFLHEEAERVTELKTATGGRLPAGTLMLGAEGIKQAIHNFEDAGKLTCEMSADHHLVMTLRGKGLKIAVKRSSVHPRRLIMIQLYKAL
jgi:hypothetical protein